MTAQARFSIGQVICNPAIGYRGVVVDVDAEFDGDEKWQRQVANYHLRLEQPWYHVLIENADFLTYVAECDLEADDTGEPIVNPAVRVFFKGYRDSVYEPRYRLN
jgi:heat shock protein HspQ